MKNYPKISIVTVNYNNGDFIEETIKSVLDQNYPNLEYIIIDGESTDGSLDVIKKYEDRLTYWISEKDNGQYDAINKGFAKASGDILAWINSDDKYLDKSLFVVAEIFTRFKHVKWLTGFAREFTEFGALNGQITLPICRWSQKRFLVNDFQYIQQESTFWSRELWEKSGAGLDTSFDLAADMDLWARFFRYEKLYTTTFELAGFRYRSGQRSQVNRRKYLKEALSIVKRERKMLKPIQKAMLPHRFLVKWIFGIFYFWDVPFLRIFYAISLDLPPIISYDFQRSEWLNKSLMQKFSPMVIMGKQIHRQMFRKD